MSDERENDNMADKAQNDLMLQTITNIEAQLKVLRSCLSAPAGQLTSEKAPAGKSANKSDGNPEAKRNGKRRFVTAESLPANQLGPIPDYTATDWPMAAPEQMIVRSDSEEAKRFRAMQIIALLGMALQGKTVLDCGCGDGFVANELGNQTKSVGYDIAVSPIWDRLTTPNVSYSTDKSVIEKNKYDVIILYDVIDHLEREDPITFLEWLASLLAPNGQIFVRAHPWTSRTGGHLYEQTNKAFLHLALTPDELVKEGLKLPYNLKLIRPMASYELMFRGANLTIEARKATTEPVEQFFSDSILDRIIKTTWKGAMADKESYLKIMANSFIDYRLSR